MLVELDRFGVEALIFGCNPSSLIRNEKLAQKAKVQVEVERHKPVIWKDLGALSDNELIELYHLCRRYF